MISVVVKLVVINNRLACSSLSERSFFEKDWWKSFLNNVEK